MPAGAVGSSWAHGSWDASAWEAQVWVGSATEANAVVAVRQRTTVQDGGLLVKDPLDELVVGFDFSELLASSSEIATATFTIVALRPSTDTALTQDEGSAGSQAAQARVLGGTVGALYLLRCVVVTDESPAQTFRRSVQIKVETL